MPRSEKEAAPSGHMLCADAQEEVTSARASACERTPRRDHATVGFLKTDELNQHNTTMARPMIWCWPWLMLVPGSTMKPQWQVDKRLSG